MLLKVKLVLLTVSLLSSAPHQAQAGPTRAWSWFLPVKRELLLVGGQALGPCEKPRSNFDWKRCFINNAELNCILGFQNLSERSDRKCSLSALRCEIRAVHPAIGSHRASRQHTGTEKGHRSCRSTSSGCSPCCRWTNVPAHKVTEVIVQVVGVAVCGIGSDCSFLWLSRAL